MTKILFFILFSVSLFAQDVNVILISGDSKARGQASSSNLVSPYAGVLPNSFIFQPNNGAGGAFTPLEGGVNNAANAGRFGIEIKLAYDLQLATGKPTYIIKRAVNGSEQCVIDQPNWNYAGNSLYHLYIRDNVTKGLNKLNALGLTYEVKGVVHITGRNDSNICCGNWECECRDTRTHIRSIVGDYDVPFITFMIHDFGNGCVDIIRHLQDRFDDDDPNTYTIDSDSFPTLDGVHEDHIGVFMMSDAVMSIIN